MVVPSQSLILRPKSSSALNRELEMHSNVDACYVHASRVSASEKAECGNQRTPPIMQVSHC